MLVLFLLLFSTLSLYIYIMEVWMNRHQIEVLDIFSAITEAELSQKHTGPPPLSTHIYILVSTCSLLLNIFKVKDSYYHLSYYFGNICQA
jgi:hypothetical protein